MKNNKTHIDYLQDDRFIQWQLAQDESLIAYWENYLKENPQEEAKLAKAITLFKQIKIGEEHISEQDSHYLLHAILHSVEKQKSKRKRYLTILSAVAGIALLIFIGDRYITSQDNVLMDLAKNDVIVGETLNSEDIHLITSQGTQSFKGDIDLALNEKGEAVISEKGSTENQTIKVQGEDINTLIVPYGKRSQITLADGSRVWLNSGSKLTFPTSFTADTRRISLEGEMYIDVAKNQHKPFIVSTNNLQISVLGTAFNISSYPSDAKDAVILVKGKVKVQDAKAEVELLPNEMLEYEQSSFTKKKVDASLYTSWKEGYLQFENTPMPDVLKKVGRYYNLSFEYEKEISLAKRTCTGKIYLSENIDNVMKTISLLTGTTIKKENNVIYIKP